MRRCYAMLSRRREVYGICASLFVAATLLVMLLVGANPDCNAAWITACSRSANSMRWSALAQLSEAIYEVAVCTIFYDVASSPA